MRFFLFITVLFLIACGSNETKKEDKTVSITPSLVTARKLVSIVDDSSFSRFKELFNDAGYILADSSVDSRNEIIYITKEKIGPGTLGVTFTKEQKVTYLHFSTTEESFFERLKKELREMGATEKEYEGAVEFRLADIYISTSNIPKDAEVNGYEIVMFREKKMENY